MPTYDKFQGEWEKAKLKRLLEKGPKNLVDKYYFWYKKNNRDVSKPMMPEFEGKNVKKSSLNKYRLIEKLARLSPEDDVRSIVNELRVIAGLSELAETDSVPPASEFKGYQSSRPTLPFAAGGTGAGLETPAVISSAQTPRTTPQNIPEKKQNLRGRQAIRTPREVSPPPPPSKPAATPRPPTMAKATGIPAPAPAPSEVIPGIPLPASSLEEEKEEQREEPPVLSPDERDALGTPPPPPEEEEEPVPPVAPQMAAPVAPPVESVVNKRVVSTVPRSETQLPTKIDMIPPERLSAENKTVAELKADIAYFKKTFPKELKGIKYNSKTKSIEVLKRVHKQIVAKLMAGKKEDTGKKIGIIISGSDFIKEKLKEIILENSINGLSAQDLLINVEGKEKEKVSDVGTYEIKVAADGMPSAKKEPIYRYIPEEKQAPIRLKRRPARIPPTATKYRGLEETAKKEVRNNPFAKKQPSIRLKYSY